MPPTTRSTSHALPSLRLGGHAASPSLARRLLFAGSTVGSVPADLGLLIVRLVGGLSLALAHGRGKVPPSEGFIGRVEGMGFVAPELFAWLAATAEFGGGLLIALGLLTRPAALLVTGNMLIVALVAHAGDPFGDREKPLLFAAVALLCLLAGAGRFSLDALFRRRG